MKRGGYRPKAPAPPPAKGDILAQVGAWTIYANEPGYSLLIQYEDGQKRFTSHAAASALMGALMEALRKDAPP